MVNHDTVLRRVEMQAVRIQANNDKRSGIIDAANKRQLATERGRYKPESTTWLLALRGCSWRKGS